LSEQIAIDHELKHPSFVGQASHLPAGSGKREACPTLVSGPSRRPRRAPRTAARTASFPPVSIVAGDVPLVSAAVHWFGVNGNFAFGPPDTKKAVEIRSPHSLTFHPNPQKIYTEYISRRGKVRETGSQASIWFFGQRIVSIGS